MALLQLLQDVNVKEVSIALKEALDETLKEKSIWEKAYEVYSKNPTQVTLGVVGICMAVYAIYLFKFDDSGVGTNSYKVTKYKKIIDSYKETQVSNKKKGSNNGVGGMF